MKIKKRTLRLSALILALILTAFLLCFFFMPREDKIQYRFSGDKFDYSGNRGEPRYELSPVNITNEMDSYSVKFYSRNFLQYETKIYGLLYIPKNKKNVPGIVFLPGGGVKKEDAVAAGKMAEEGYAVLTFDQRGIGETGGYYLGIEQDYEVFAQGKEPIQHLSVYDALKAYDVLRKIKSVDKNNIAIVGESMGGRYAIIAAAIEKRFKGAVIISSAGFHTKKDNMPYNPYLRSIDPDNYIGDIAPRKIVMMHGGIDKTIMPIESNITFMRAKEPKEYFLFDGCAHGYCTDMDQHLQDSLKSIFGR